MSLSRARPLHHSHQPAHQAVQVDGALGLDHLELDVAAVPALQLRLELAHAVGEADVDGGGAGVDRAVDVCLLYTSPSPRD